MRPRTLVSVVLFASLLIGCAASNAPRTDTNISKGWEFSDDQFTWEKVDLPHTWNEKDGQDGGDDYRRGPGWYRKSIKIDKRDAGRSFFLRFEGAATVAEVYVNGDRVGEHRGNFAAFCFDVTKFVKIGEANDVTVRVDNTKRDDIPPLSGDFTIFGGIYRDVHLLALDPLSISPLDDASPGVYLKQSHVDKSSATVLVTTKLRNDHNQSKTATVVVTIKDQTGKEVTSATVDRTVTAKSTTDAIATLSIAEPHLWDGVRDPYLYTARIAVWDGDVMVDAITQPLGLRSFRVDPERGFILNGKPYPLHGVNRHQDRQDKGWAISADDQREDFAIIQEMGSTGVRLAHFQQSELAYTLCDAGGLVCWAENGLVNEIRATPKFTESAVQQTRELVKQNFNHPSIVCWSLFNELAMREAVNPDDDRLINQLNDLVHSLDPTRPTVCATHKQNTKTPEIWITDLTAFNRYWGWYQGTPWEWAKGLDELRAATSPHALGISEYGAGASVKQHELNPTTRPKTSGAWHPEVWQSIVHEQAWKAMRDQRWMWCSFIWVMFDFAADQRKEGDQPGRNDKGLVTFDRKVRKDAFYFYKANWSVEPVLHITSKRFNPRPNGAQEIKVYSNCDEVELIVNGRSMGKRRGEDGVFVWPDVALVDGMNKVEASGVRQGKTLKDEVMWKALRTAATQLTLP